MKHIKNDQRAIRSAEAIYAALAELMEDSAFQTIMVSQLVEQAQIGRATFYRNFDGLEDVLQWRSDQIVEEFFVYLADYRQKNQLSSMLPFLKPILRFFYLNSDVVELLIKANRVDILQQAVHERVVKISRVLGPMLGIPTSALEYGPVIRSGVMMSVLVHWIKGGKRETPDELADALEVTLQKLREFNATQGHDL